MGGLLKIERLDYSQVFQCPYGSEGESYTKILNVSMSGVVVLNVLVGSYTDQPSYVVTVKIVPGSSKSAIQTTYFPETTNKLLKYVTESDGSITLYSKNIRFKKTGFSIIVYDQINTIYNEYVSPTDIPADAVDI